MSDLYVQGYATRILLEASLVHGDKGDDARYYKLEAAMDASAKECTFSTVERTYAVDLGAMSVETIETLASEQGAVLTFNGAAEVAREVLKRARPMDRLRVEVASSAFPKYDVNLGTGGDMITETEGVIATNRLWHTPSRPSRLILN